MFTDELKDKYKHIDPAQLEAYGLLTRARKSGFLCPFCSNGLGEDGTGADYNRTNDGYKGFCHRCNTYFDVFDLVAARYRLDVRAQFGEVVKKVQEIFGDTPKILPSKPPERKNENFTSFIRRAFSNLDALFITQKKWRGLTKETLKKFGCGYTQAWSFQGKTTPRVIIPTSYFHFLARYPAETADSSINIKPHRGLKEIFGLRQALAAQQENANVLIFAVEGEIDAMSIVQCGFTAIAFSGSALSEKQRSLLEKFPKATNFILMLDADETGKKQTPIIHKILEEKNFRLYDAFLDEKFADANAWLQVDPAGLKKELQRIYSSAEKFFAENPPPKKSEYPEGIQPSKVAGIVEITPDYKPPSDSNSDWISGGITTRQQIPSCPIDLVIPENYIFKRGCILQKIESEKKGTVEILFTHTPIVPTRILRKADNSDTQIELAVYEREKDKWSKILKPMSTIADTRGIITLADHGVSVNSSRAKYLSDFLTDIQHTGDNQKKIPRVLVYEQPGWKGLNNEDFIYPPAGDGFIVQNGGFNYEEKFAEAGEISEWLDAYFYAYHTLIGRYAIGLALAAPLVKLCHSRNWQGVLVGSSGAGKSAVAKLALSIFGNPDKLRSTFGGTTNFSDEISPKLNDLPCWIDEFQSADKKVRENFQTFIYNYAEGKSRGRLSRDATMKKQYEFSGTRLCTSEQVVLQGNYMEGAYNRTIQLQGFEGLPDPLAVKIHQILAKSYGHFGKMYIEYVKEHRAQVVQLYQKLQEDYKPLRFQSHHLAHISLVYTGEHFFHRMLKEKFPNEELPPIEPLDKLKGDIGYFNNLLPTPQESDGVKRVLDFLHDSVFSQSHRFATLEVRINAPNEYFSSSFDNTLGCIFKGGNVNGDIAFFPAALNKFLLSEGWPDAHTVMRELNSRELLEIGSGKDAKNFKVSKHFGSMGSKKVYYIKKAAFDLL